MTVGKYISICIANFHLTKTVVYQVAIIQSYQKSTIA